MERFCSPAGSATRRSPCRTWARSCYENTLIIEEAPCDSRVRPRGWKRRQTQSLRTWFTVTRVAWIARVKVPTYVSKIVNYMQRERVWSAPSPLWPWTRGKSHKTNDLKSEITRRKTTRVSHHKASTLTMTHWWKKYFQYIFFLKRITDTRATHT